MSRPETHDDLSDWQRQGHLVANIPSEHITRYDIEGATYPVGYYAPGTREHVEWNPDTHYPPESVTFVEASEVAELDLPKSAMVKVDAVKFAREELAREVSS